MPARILVIEDNPANLELMSYLLRARGHQVLKAGNGLEGLAAVQRERPDLVLCDVQMPGLDGFEIAQRLKGEPASRAIPLVAVTALAMVGDRERVLAGGFDGYLPKPIDPLRFGLDIESLLAKGPPPEDPGRQWEA